MASNLTQTSSLPPHQLSSTLDQTLLQKPQPLEVHHVTANFNYYKDAGDGKPPPPLHMDNPESFISAYETRSLIVHDIRGTEEQYTLDKSGFQIYKHQSVEKDFVSDEQITQVYYPEMERLLKEVTGASKVFVFGHTIRKSSHTSIVSSPVRSVHIDQSSKGVLSRIVRHFPEESEQLLKGRCQLINVWRPIKTIFKDPLAVAAANSVPDSDRVPKEVIYPDFVSETVVIRPNELHKWYFLYGQRPDEVTLIKCHDSKKDGRAGGAPHSAFVNPETEAEEPRESIEVRALVFHPDDTE